MKPLFLTAHYDDLETCAGGTAERYGGTSLVFHPREAHGTEKEANAAAKLLNIITVNPVRHMDDRTLLAIVDEYAENCDTIISCSPYDSHPDHQEVAAIARQVARRNTKALWFMDHAIPGGIGNGPRPNQFVAFGDTQKYNAIRCYKKVNEEYGPNWSITASNRDRYYGWMHGVERAEGFIVENTIKGIDV